MNYTPFDKELAELDEQQLNSLVVKSVAEGWYIEYKGGLITDGKKIAKSISSFANSEGGWYFMGIESDQKTNVATKVTGFDPETNPDLVDRISKLVIGNIAPVPAFEIKVVELKSTSVVVVIKVEDGSQPPYITSSGTIHQREHNSSNPVRDRFILEKMYDKSQKNKDRIDRFCDISYGETEGQGDEDHPYLELFMFPSPFGSFNFREFFEPDFFNSIASKFFNGMNLVVDNKGVKHESNLGLNFNAIYSSFGSLVIRPINDDALIYKGTTVELFKNGNLKFLIPLKCFSLSNIPSKYSKSSVIEYLLDRFSPLEETVQRSSRPIMSSVSPLKTMSRKKSNFVSWYKLIDGHELTLVLLYIANVYQSILEEAGYAKRKKIGYRARVSDSWRKVLFFDDDNYLKALQQYNVPATPKNEIEIPPFYDGNYLEMEQDQAAFINLCMHVFEGIGIPRNESIDYMSILETCIKNLKSA